MQKKVLHRKAWLSPHDRRSEKPHGTAAASGHAPDDGISVRRGRQHVADAQMEADLHDHMRRYDDLLDKINKELRKAGATEAQINWGLFGDVELPTLSYMRCNRMAKSLIQHSYQITYCLGELKMLSKYTDNVQHVELKRIRKDYGRRFG